MVQQILLDGLLVHNPAIHCGGGQSPLSSENRFNGFPNALLWKTVKTVPTHSGTLLPRNELRGHELVQDGGNF